MDTIGQEYPVVKYDIDSNPEEVAQYGIRSVPSVVLVNESGIEIDRFVGVKPKSFIVNLYNKELNG